jgi:hypothetical protein
MWNQIKAVSSTLLGSPKQERVSKNVNAFLTEYFNNLLIKKHTPNLGIFEECNVSEKLHNINFDKILTSSKYSISNHYEDIIDWLSNNTRSIFNEKLVKPNSELTEFISIATLDFSNNPFITKNVQYIANYLRNNKTIKQVYLDNCGINDEQVKILAEIPRFNKTITKLSLIHNKEITNAGIKTLLQMKGNGVLEIVISYAGININIFDDDSIETYLEKILKENVLDVEITNKNLQPLANFYHLERPMIKDGNELLKLIAESHNEITKTGNIIKKLIVMVGMNGVGATTLSCFLSGQKLIEDEDCSLYAKEQEYNKKIHHKADNEYKGVNNFFISDNEGGINIIECPGIHNKAIDSIQTILNSYIYWQILELAEKVKFSVIIRDNSANDVIDNTYKQFTNIFRDSNGQLSPVIQNELKDALSYIISVADYKTEGEKNTKIKAVKSKLSKDLKDSNLDEEQKFIITELEKSINLFKKPNGDTKSFLDTLDTKDFFIVIDAISLLIRTIANDEIQVEQEKILSYTEAISQSKNEEEKNANMLLIDKQTRKIINVYASSEDQGDALLNSASDANLSTTVEVITQSETLDKKS